MVSVNESGATEHDHRSKHITKQTWQKRTHDVIEMHFHIGTNRLNTSLHMTVGNEQIHFETCTKWFYENENLQLLYQRNPMSLRIN